MAGNLTCLAVGLRYADAGRGAVLAYTMQMWAIPLGYYINGDRVSREKMVLGLLAISGVVLLLNPGYRFGIGSTMVGYLVLTCAAINWAIGSCLYRRFSWSVPFWTQINVQLWTSAVTLMLAAILFSDFHLISVSRYVVGGLVYNWVIGTALCYWWWSQVLRVMPAAQGGLILCAIPLVAIAFSMTIFGEVLSMADIFGIALVLLGVVGTLVADARTSTRASAH